MGADVEMVASSAGMRALHHALDCNQEAAAPFLEKCADDEDNRLLQDCLHEFIDPISLCLPCVYVHYVLIVLSLACRRTIPGRVTTRATRLLKFCGGTHRPLHAATTTPTAILATHPRRLHIGTPTSSTTASPSKRHQQQQHPQLRPAPPPPPPPTSFTSHSQLPHRLPRLTAIHRRHATTATAIPATPSSSTTTSPSQRQQQQQQQ